MGMFDIVIAECPACKGRLEFQSKGANPPSLRAYNLADAPADVLSDVNRHTPDACPWCGTKAIVDAERKETVAVFDDWKHAAAACVYKVRWLIFSKAPAEALPFASVVEEINPSYAIHDGLYVEFYYSTPSEVYTPFGSIRLWRNISHNRMSQAQWIAVLAEMFEATVHRPGKQTDFGYSGPLLQLHRVPGLVIPTMASIPPSSRKAEWLDAKVALGGRWV